MNNELFALIILGHLVGDYLLQNKWMAMNKTGNWYTCTVHCLIYTLAVCIFTMSSVNNFFWPALVFLSHFPIDYFSLADKWLDLINGRSLKDFMVNGMEDIPTGYNYLNYHALRGGFTSLVYAVVDNTMHLILMYWFASWL